MTWQLMQLQEITILDNHAVWIVDGQERIKPGGVGELWEDIQYLGPTLHDVTVDDLVILVSHNPDDAEQLSPPAY